MYLNGFFVPNRKISKWCVIGNQTNCTLVENIHNKIFKLNEKGTKLRVIVRMLSYLVIFQSSSFFFFQKHRGGQHNLDLSWYELWVLIKSWWFKYLSSTVTPCLLQRTVSMVMKHFQKVLNVIIQQMRRSGHVLRQHTGCIAWSKKLIGYRKFTPTFT